MIYCRPYYLQNTGIIFFCISLQAVCRSASDQESCVLIKRYIAQLMLLKNRIPMEEGDDSAIAFTWLVFFWSTKLDLRILSMGYGPYKNGYHILFVIEILIMPLYVIYKNLPLLTFFDFGALKYVIPKRT